MRTTQEAIKEDLKKLIIWDDEIYHWVFDSLLEKRLEELDPEYMLALWKAYSDSWMARWCA